MDTTIATKRKDTHETEPRLLYDRKAAARMLSISIRSLDYLLQRREFRTRRIGKKVLIPHGELIRYSRGDHFGVSISSPKKKRPFRYFMLACLFYRSYCRR
jgi:hypothetical protein